MYLLIYLEYMPNVFKPGNNEIKDMMKELALEEE